MNLLQETIEAIEYLNKDINDIQEYCIEIDQSFESIKYVPKSNKTTTIVKGSSGENLIKEQKLNLEYDAYSGNMYIEGWISFKDSSWLQREFIQEYQEEYWAYYTCPKLI